VAVSTSSGVRLSTALNPFLSVRKELSVPKSVAASPKSTSFNQIHPSHAETNFFQLTKFISVSPKTNLFKAKPTYFNQIQSSQAKIKLFPPKSISVKLKPTLFNQIHASQSKPNLVQANLMQSV
jgi:hypothetical protein